jgi:hypothetical protein
MNQRGIPKSLIALAAGLSALAAPVSTQERAYTSPIWYTP